MPKPPLEARAVEDMMKLRRQSPGGADATRSSLKSPPLPTEEAGVATAAPATTMSIQDRLEGQRPRAVAAWLQFRVANHKLWLHSCGFPSMLGTNRFGVSKTSAVMTTSF